VSKFSESLSKEGLIPIIGAMKSNSKIPFAVRKFSNSVGYGFKSIKIKSIKYYMTLAIAKKADGFPVAMVAELRPPTAPEYLFLC